MADLGYEVNISAADPLVLFESHDATNQTDSNRASRILNTYSECEKNNVTIHCLKPTKTFRLDYESVLCPDINIVKE